MSDVIVPQHIAISCSNSVKDILCEALKSYAQDVLPEKEAGQYGATRHQLLNVIRNLEKPCLNNNDVLLIDHHYKGPCVAAIHHHFSRIHQTLHISVDEQKQLLLDLLQGVPVCDQKLDSALQRDQLL
jgi:hypothetical protein